MSGVHPLAKEIAAVSGWLATADVIRTNLKLPDLSTSSGLRQVARSPHKVYPRLEKAYTDHLKDPLVLGAIALIWGRIWTEPRARESLYETGFLINIIRLITTTPECRTPALQALVTIVHHATQPVLTDIAHRTTRTLLLLLRSDGESSYVHELCTIILTHAIAPSQSLDVCRTDGVDFSSLIHALTRATHRPTATKTMQAHLLGFLRATATRLHFNIFADPSTVFFLIAQFPSTNFATRGTALLALNDLHAAGAEHERSSWDPNAYHKAAIKAQTDLPEDLIERMEAHVGGVMLNDIYVNVRATDEFQEAMTDVLEDKDMYALAKRLYPMVLATESSVPQGAFRGKDGELLSTEVVGLPFSSFVDALHHAAQAIRARGIPNETVAADTLEVKYALLTRDYANVRRICTERIESDPHIAFFYYALVLSAGSSSGDPNLRRMPTAERLKLAKRGLMCEGSTAYVRLGLHKVATECAYKLGMDRLKTASGPAMGPVNVVHHAGSDEDSDDEELSPRKATQAYTEAIVFLTSALDDARAYTKSAPLDYRLHKNVLLLQIVLSVALEGTGVRGLGEAISQLTDVDELYTTLYGPTPKSQSRLIVDKLITNWETAQQEWDSILRKFDTRAPVGAPAHTHNHPHEQDLIGELDPEMGISGLGRPPTYISTLEIPVPQVGGSRLDPVQEREEENLRQAYAALAGWMEGAPSMGISSNLGGDSLITPISATPITPSPITPHSTSPHTPSVAPCPLDRRPYVDVHAVPIMLYKCFACGNPSDGSELKTCSGCRRTKYCDEVCQKKHWVNGHGDECLTTMI
ncbi:MYND Zn-finger protein [Ceratobasidium sp. AG-Ba]|nr:MYND Zn-finger protein [Ceratobasidium sp. AG-Ba]